MRIDTEIKRVGQRVFLRIDGAVRTRARQFSNIEGDRIKPHRRKALLL